MTMTLTNPVFKAKVVSYERLAYSPKGVWFREYELFPDKYSLDMWQERIGKDCYNIRNVEIYEVLIDITKPEQPVLFPKRICAGCGKGLDGDRHVVNVEGKDYCGYDCYCNHREDCHG